ncbi:MAG: GAF domain-containing SpoIIE family protein phosphatase [Bacteroidota bacterium]
MSSPDVLQQETQRLKRAVEELSILNDLARAIGASLNSEDIMQTIIRKSLRAVSAEQGVITLVEKKSDEPMKTLVRAMVSSAEQSQFHFHQALMGWMHLNVKPLLVEDPQRDERFRGVRWDESIQCLLCVPLLVKSELKGVLTVYNKKNGQKFTTDDQRLLAIIAAQSAQVIENARLHEEEKAFMKMQEEVRLAAKIQIDLLPQKPPDIEGYQIIGKTLSAQEVGGDYYDFIHMEGQRMAICLGDVTGKGLPASLLMANLQATLRGQTLVATSPGECLNRSNKLLFQSTSPEKFATLFYGILDFKNHTLFYSNAGHDHPILVSTDRTTARLGTGGIMLGAFEDFSFEEASVRLKPGDLLVLYSDGISEAMNSKRDQYGDQPLLELVKRHQEYPVGQILEAIMEDVRKHVDNYPQSDDMTLVIVKRN